MMRNGGDVFIDNKVRRFAPSRIVEHWLMVMTFGILIATGLSQKFYTLELSRWIISQLGGIDSVRLLHRYTGVGFSSIFLIHVLTNLFGIGMKKWEPSMMVKRKDFKDVIHNIQYYIGLQNSPAQCGRYDYRQKFDYWSILMSAFIMVATGFTLWFPTIVARFMPGEIIPTAKILHTNQAFLAFLIIAVWHIYNSIFSPEVFPLDTSIFTGKISIERMKREHPLEYRDMMEENPELEEYSQYSDYGGMADHTIKT